MTLIAVDSRSRKAECVNKYTWAGRDVFFFWSFQSTQLCRHKADEDTADGASARDMKVPLHLAWNGNDRKTQNLELHGELIVQNVAPA